MSASAAAPVREVRVKAVFAGLMLAMLLASLDQTIVATALPTIVEDVGGLDHISWVTTAYLLASTASTPLYGKLGDLYGRKRVFQTAIVIFLIGSALCGLAQGMLELILFRALQGLGGGGLIVGAQAIIGDVVSPRDRGRYQGYFGAVFGVTSVAGPLLGGFFVEHLSWRWIFYINLPIGAIALVVIAAVLPATATHVQHRIDWLGTGLMASGVSAVILFLSLGGTSQPWGSPQSIALAAGGVALLTAFVFAERRAAEPILPLRLFSNRVFAVASAIGFIVGFGLYGSVTFLPLFLQVVNGAGATESGLQMVPMMAGVLLTSIGSGQIISRTGRYRVFPIVGTAVMGVGFVLLAQMDPETGIVGRSVAMLVLGLGLGLVMQVLVLAVQNAVDYRDLGTATSGATFFRSIGGSFGVAIFGTIFSNRLETTLREEPTQVEAYASALQTVFLTALPVAAIAFALTWLLREVPLRRTVESSGIGESFAMPKTDTSLDEIARAVTTLARRDQLLRIYERLGAQAGVELSPSALWLLARIADMQPVTLAHVSTHCNVSHRRLVPSFAELADAGLVAGEGGALTLTEAGVRVRARIVEARRARLEELLAGWSPEQHDELARFLVTLAGDLGGEVPHPLPEPEERGARGGERGGAGAAR